MTIRLCTPLKANFSDIAEVIHIFYPDAEIVDAPQEACDILHRHSQAEGWAENEFIWNENRFYWTTRIQGDRWEQKRRHKRALKQCCYYLLRRHTGMRPPWGSLTGIRPTRLFYERLSRGEAPAIVHDMLIHLFDLREDKAQLLEDTVIAQRGLIEAPPDAIDLYVGIPFCSTRCTYCSFFAEAIGKGRKVPAYLDALLLEMNETAQMIGRLRLIPRAIYVGGGTPTALMPDQLRLVVQTLRAQYPDAREFTVEAGRPDTITREKLAILSDAGVTRISINPQTMNGDTLRVIGRAHSAQDTEKAFTMAREAGFDNINMDIIAALPKETIEQFEHTLRAVKAMAPDSLTIHTLARKHGSRLNEFGFSPTEGTLAERMVEMGHACAESMGMHPYYLYRQKYVAGNLENVAYALPGKESLYNIDIMEETTSVMAMGAGAISKRVFPEESRIERAPNVGDVGHYISRVAEMILRKRKLWGLDAPESTAQ